MTRMRGWYGEPARHSLAARGVKSKWQVPKKGSPARVPVTRRMKFMLGQVVITPGAFELLTERGLNPNEFLARHMSGDWGDLHPEDVKIQNAALETGSDERLMSVYNLGGGDKIWIITEWDRSVTTIMLPEEY